MQWLRTLGKLMRHDGAHERTHDTTKLDITTRPSNITDRDQQVIPSIIIYHQTITYSTTKNKRQAKSSSKSPLQTTLFSMYARQSVRVYLFAINLNMQPRHAQITNYQQPAIHAARYIPKCNPMKMEKKRTPIIYNNPYCALIFHASKTYAYISAKKPLHYLNSIYL